MTPRKDGTSPLQSAMPHEGQPRMVSSRESSGCDSYKQAMTLSRRAFLGGLGALALPAVVPRFAAALSSGAAVATDVLVCIFLRGGADALNAIVPYGDAWYYQHRPHLAIPAPSSLQQRKAINLDGFFGLHPALAPLRRLWIDAHLAIVHATGLETGTHSHFDAMRWMESADPGHAQHLATGWLGRHLATVANDNPSAFRGVGFGAFLPPSLNGPVPALTIESINNFDLYGDSESPFTYRQQLLSLYGGTEVLDVQAQKTLQAIDVLQPIDSTTYVPENGAVYPEDSLLAAQLRQIAQLLKANIGIEVVGVDLDGWDTHEGQGGVSGSMADLLAELALSLRAFYTDMLAHADRLTIVTMSEFGRRVAENASEGTDHGEGGSMLVLGGGVRGRRVYGTWPGLAPQQLTPDGDLQTTTDYRHVLAEIVAKRLGNGANLQTVFPGFTPQFLGICQRL